MNPTLLLTSLLLIGAGALVLPQPKDTQGAIIGTLNWARDVPGARGMTERTKGQDENETTTTEMRRAGSRTEQAVDIVIAVTGIQSIDITDDKFKSYLKEASKTLWYATHGAARLGSVTFLVPESWTLDASDGNEIWLGATPKVDMVFLDTHPTMANDVWTQHRLPCRHPGDLVFVKKDFIGGNAGRPTIARAIAKGLSTYLWGVFDEHGYPGDALYPELLNDNNGTMSNQCVDNDDVSKATSSLMAISEEGSWNDMKEFCSDESHVAATWTRQHSLCRASVWASLPFSLQDFPDVPSDVPADTLITYRPMRAEHVVLALEWTNTTASRDLGHHLLRAASSALMYDLAWGTQVWVLIFYGNEVKVAVSDTVLTSHRVRQRAYQSLHDTIDTNPPFSGCRNLKKVIEQAGQILVNLNTNKRIVLITTAPGKDTSSDAHFCEPTDSEDLGSLQRGSRVDTILYPANMFDNTYLYDQMALNPKGSVLKVEDWASLKTFRVLTNTLRGLDKATTEEGLLADLHITQDYQCHFSFNIDPSTPTSFPLHGYLALYKVSWDGGPEMGEVMVRLENDEGDQTWLLGERTENKNTIWVSLTLTTAGPWTVELERSGCEDMALYGSIVTTPGYQAMLDVSGMPELLDPTVKERGRERINLMNEERKDSEAFAVPLKILGEKYQKKNEGEYEGDKDYVAVEEMEMQDVDVSVDAKVDINVVVSAPLHQLDFSNPVSNPVVVSARVTSEGKPVVRAVVVARQCGTPEELVLRDNGSGGPDTTRNDGVYSGIWHMKELPVPPTTPMTPTTPTPSPMTPTTEPTTPTTIDSSTNATDTTSDITTQELGFTTGPPVMIKSTDLSIQTTETDQSTLINPTTTEPTGPPLTTGPVCLNITVVSTNETIILETENITCCPSDYLTPNAAHQPLSVEGWAAVYGRVVGVSSASPSPAHIIDLRASCHALTHTQANASVVFTSPFIYTDNHGTNQNYIIKMDESDVKVFDSSLEEVEYNLEVNCGVMHSFIVRDEDSRIPYSNVASVECPCGQQQQASSTGVILGAVFGTLGGVLLIGALVFVYMKKFRGNTPSQNNNLEQSDRQQQQNDYTSNPKGISKKHPYIELDKLAPSVPTDGGADADDDNIYDSAEQPAPRALPPTPRKPQPPPAPSQRQPPPLPGKPPVPGKPQLPPLSPGFPPPPTSPHEPAPTPVRQADDDDEYEAAVSQGDDVYEPAIFNK